MEVFIFVALYVLLYNLIKLLKNLKAKQVRITAWLDAYKKYQINFSIILTTYDIVFFENILLSKKKDKEITLFKEANQKVNKSIKINFIILFSVLLITLFVSVFYTFRN